MIQERLLTIHGRSITYRVFLWILISSSLLKISIPKVRSSSKLSMQEILESKDGWISHNTNNPVQILHPKQSWSTLQSFFFLDFMTIKNHGCEHWIVDKKLCELKLSMETLKTIFAKNRHLMLDKAVTQTNY